MFDFLTSEVWWMETIIAAVIEGLVTIVGALIGGLVAYKIASNETKKGVERINEILDKVNLIETKANFSNDHQNLKRDHSDLLEKMSDVSKTASFLKDETIKTKAIREEASKRELNPQIIVDTITALTTELAELKAENENLKKENASLKGQLQQRNKSIDRDFDCDLEL